jgi:hypothetical protein
VARAVAATLAFLLSACAHGGGAGASPDEFTIGTARFRIVYTAEDAASARQVRRAIEAAVPRLDRWGGLRYPVTVTIHPTHEALEEAVNRRGYDWLHAWARFDTIDLQSPRTWHPSGAERRELHDLITHELTHCTMYQLAGTELTWMFKEIPRWFSEGLACVTAEQDYKYAGLQELWDFYRESSAGAGDGAPAPVRRMIAVMAQPGDPVVDPDPIYEEQWRIVYGAACHATEFLVTRYGERAALDLMRRMGKGFRFPAAFKDAVGITDAEFAADFRRYVVWQGWKR